MLCACVTLIACWLQHSRGGRFESLNYASNPHCCTELCCGLDSVSSPHHPSGVPRLNVLPHMAPSEERKANVGSCDLWVGASVKKSVNRSDTHAFNFKSDRTSRVYNYLRDQMIRMDGVPLTSPQSYIIIITPIVQ